MTGGLSSRGFTLVELLVATLVLLAVCGALAALSGPARLTFDRSLGVADASSRGRAGIETLLAELRQAGAGAVIGPLETSLADLMPVVLPARSLDDPCCARPYESISVAGAPALAPQALLRDRADTGAAILRIDASGPCPGTGDTCGFEGGMQAVVYDIARLEPIVVASTGSGTLLLGAPLSGTFERGAVVVAIEWASYGLREDREGTRRLVRRTGAGAEQPIVDHIVEFDVLVFDALAPLDADMLRARRVDVRMRVEAASAALRGPAGRLFRRAGTAGHAARWAPDVELRVSVALRNR